MLSADFHVHTLRSRCGLHTLLEMIDCAASRGLQGVAITDHGAFCGGPGVSSVFLRRFPNEHKGLRVWKGIEANPLPEGGTDIPADMVPWFDVILLGIHNVPQDQPREYYTDLLLSRMADNPFVDILVHPDSMVYPLDVARLVEAAAGSGMAVEFNNANLTHGKTDLSRMKAMAEAVVGTGCRAVISSDSHTINEVGDDSHARRALAEMGFADIALVNETFESAEAFIEERRALLLVAR